MRDRDKLRRLRRVNEVQTETLDEYRNTINLLERKIERIQIGNVNKQIVLEEIRDIYNLINFQDCEFRFNKELREARKKLNKLSLALRTKTDETTN